MSTPPGDFDYSLPSTTELAYQKWTSDHGADYYSLPEPNFTIFMGEAHRHVIARVPPEELVKWLDERLVMEVMKGQHYSTQKTKGNLP